MVNKKQLIYEWSIVRWPDIELTLHNPEKAYGILGKDSLLALHGMAIDDYRANPATGEFIDGYRIVTSLICEARIGMISTKNTEYELREINPHYMQWCAEKGHNIISVLAMGYSYEHPKSNPSNHVIAFMFLSETQ